MAVNSINRTRPATKREIAKAAAEYAALGWPVFPLRFGEKEPATAHGFKDATTDCEQLSNWFQNLSRNVGIATGEESGLLVIDADIYKDGCQFDIVEQQLGPLPDTYQVKTANGGHHYYFNYPTGDLVNSSQSKLGAKIDVRAEGGYVVAPPSTANNKKYGVLSRYEVTRHIPLADLPNSWLAKLIDHDLPSLKFDNNMHNGLVGKPRFVLPDEIPDGTRNDTLIRYAGQLRSKGTSEAEILNLLLETNERRCIPPLGKYTVTRIARQYAVNNGGDDPQDKWPEPVAVNPPQPRVPELDVHALPDAFQGYVVDSSERMQCPPEFIACALMVGAAATIGNIVTLQPKARDTGWMVTATLWGAIVGRPGMLKTPALEAGVRSLRGIEERLRQEHQLKMDEYAATKTLYDIALANAKRLAKNSAVDASSIPVEPTEPDQERIIVNDSTPEKLVEILKGSPRGVLLMLDEISGLLATLDKRGYEGARALYLSGWNGLQSHSSDRIGRGSTYIPRVNIGILGGIQPGKLQKYVRGAADGGDQDDGLMQRFQFIVFPDPPTEWKHVDRVPNLSAHQQVNDVFSALRSINPEKIGATASPFDDTSRSLHFAGDAQVVFDEWLLWLENKLLNNNYSPALESHLAKYRSLVPALALINHLVDVGTGRVGKKSLLKAIKMALFLWKHALRVYAVVTQVDQHSAYALSKKIEEGKLTSPFTARLVQRHGWSQLDTTATVADAISVLCEKGWFVQERVLTEGKARVDIHINPKVLGE